MLCQLCRMHCNITSQNVSPFCKPPPSACPLIPMRFLVILMAEIPLLAFLPLCNAVRHQTPTVMLAVELVIWGMLLRAFLLFLLSLHNFVAQLAASHFCVLNVYFCRVAWVLACAARLLQWNKRCRRAQQLRHTGLPSRVRYCVCRLYCLPH